MKMSDFTPEERAEIVRAVIDASYDEEGTARTVEETRVEFDRFVSSAIQAHRGWAERLLDAWRIDGERAFVKDVQKSDAFSFTHNGRKRHRSIRRGTRVRLTNGERVWVQSELFGWTVEQLEQAIRESARRIEEERANISVYRALLALMQETGAAFVTDALDAIGKSLEEFLTDRAA